MNNNVLERINQEAIRIDWPELVEYADEVVSSDSKYKHQYLNRLLFRVKNAHWKKPCEFDQIRIEQRLEGNYIMFYNYSLKAFSWAHEKGFTEWLDNNYFLVPYEKLSKENLEKLKAKAINNYKKITEP